MWRLYITFALWWPAAEFPRYCSKQCRCGVDLLNPPRPSLLSSASATNKDPEACKSEKEEIEEIKPASAVIPNSMFIFKHDNLWVPSSHSINHPAMTASRHASRPLAAYFALPVVLQGASGMSLRGEPPVFWNVHPAGDRRQQHSAGSRGPCSHILRLE